MKEGFLLIELLIAVTIFLGVLFAVTKYQTICLKNYILALKKNEALSLALSLIEDTEIDRLNINNSCEFDVVINEVNCVKNLRELLIFLSNIFGEPFVVRDFNFELSEVQISFKLFDWREYAVVISG